MSCSTWTQLVMKACTDEAGQPSSFRETRCCLSTCGPSCWHKKRGESTATLNIVFSVIWYFMSLVVSFSIDTSFESIHKQYTLKSVISTFLMSLLSLISWNPRERMSLLVIMYPSRISWVLRLVNHERSQPTWLHAPRCHHCSYCRYCNVDFVLFHIVTCYTNSFLSRFLVDTT